MGVVSRSVGGVDVEGDGVLTHRAVVALGTEEAVHEEDGGMGGGGVMGWVMARVCEGHGEEAGGAGESAIEGGKGALTERRAPHGGH